MKKYLAAILVSGAVMSTILYFSSQQNSHEIRELHVLVKSLTQKINSKETPISKTSAIERPEKKKSTKELDVKIPLKNASASAQPMPLSPEKISATAKKQIGKVKNSMRIDEDPSCKKQKRSVFDFLSVETFPQQNNSIFNKSSQIYQNVKGNWNRFVLGALGRCFGFPYTPTDTSLDGKYFRELFGLYSSYSTSCPNLLRFGGPGDGGKMLCDDVIPCQKCVVYSLGSGRNFAFEYHIARYYGCEIHTFDCTAGGRGGGDLKITHFHDWCVGGKDETIKGLNYFTLSTIMKKLNHSFIDVLKMDIERYEYMVVETMLKLNPSLLPKQIAFEVHLSEVGDFKQRVKFNQFDEFWDRVRDMGYRVVTHEINPIDKCCSEYLVMR